MRAIRCYECGSIGPGGEACDRCGRVRPRNHHLKWIAVLVVLAYFATVIYRGTSPTSEVPATMGVASPIGEPPMDADQYRAVIAAISKRSSAVYFSGERISAVDPAVQCGVVREGESVRVDAPRPRRFVVLPRMVLVEGEAAESFDAAWQRYCSETTTVNSISLSHFHSNMAVG